MSATSHTRILFTLHEKDEIHFQIFFFSEQKPQFARIYRELSLNANNEIKFDALLCSIIKKICSKSKKMKQNH